MKTNSLKVIFLLFVLLSSCTEKQLLTDEEQNWLKQHPDLKVSIYGSYPPYLFENQKGSADGIFIDYLDIIEEKINYSFKRVHYSNWSELFHDASYGKVDIVLDIQKTKKRELIFDFYSEIFSSNYIIVTRKEKPISYKDLATSNIIVPEDYAISEILKKNIPNIKINTFPSESRCLEILSKGNYDAYIGPKSVVNYYIHNLNISNLIINDVTPFYYRPGISVTKNKQKLSKIIKKAVKSISQKEREVIFNNWLYSEVKPFYRKISFWVSIIILLGLILAAIGYFNRLLKHKVTQRTAELEKAKKNAEKSSNVKTRFIQNISHEIRTPMNSILGFSELLRKENASNQEHLAYIDTIIDSGKHLIHVIDSILEISNFRTETAKVNLEEIHLKSVFENTESYFISVAKKKNLDFSFSTNIKKNDTVIIDKNRLQKIVNNLIDNSLKFTSKGSIDISYNLLINNSLEIEIRDTGKGIREEDKEIIFDSFSQLENEISDQYTGLGLGLTIVKENVSALEGTLTFKSKLGEGSIFTVSIPCEKVINPIAPPSSQKKSGATILIIEDAEINFLLVKSVLERMKEYDFNILRAENGKIGVEMCNSNPNIDLVIMDIRMPVMNGYEATTIIKEKYPELTIVAHTAYSTDADIKKALEVGCATVLAKPMEIELFKETIIKYINA